MRGMKTRSIIAAFVCAWGACAAAVSLAGDEKPIIVCDQADQTIKIYEGGRLGLVIARRLPLPLLESRLVELLPLPLYT